MLNLPKVNGICRKQKSAVNVNAYMYFGIWQQVTRVVTLH